MACPLKLKSITMSSLEGSIPTIASGRMKPVQAVLSPGSDGHYHIAYRTIGLEDGKERWLDARARVFFDEKGQALRMIGATIDISENKRLIKDLEQRNLELDAERLKWQRLIEGIADEVWACDLEGRVSLLSLKPQTGGGAARVNEEVLKRLLGEFEVLRPDGFVRPDEESPLQRSLKGELVRGEERVRMRSTGDIRIRQHSAVPVRDTEGRIVGAVAIVRDITEAREAEAEVRRLNEELEDRVRQRTDALERANKELEAFSYSVSHDLRSPLRLINGFADLMVRQGQESFTEKQQESLKTIQAQVALMDELIKALLEFSRLGRKELRLVRVDTRKMAEEVVAEQRQVFGEEMAKRVACRDRRSADGGSRPDSLTHGFHESPVQCFQVHPHGQGPDGQD